MLYDDGKIVCDETGLRITGYYFPWGTKRIPFTSIRSFTRRPLTLAAGKWRIWGSGDFVHWWNLDTGRPRKDAAFVLNTGRRIRPSITPDDPDAVERILTGHVRSTS